APLKQMKAGDWIVYYSSTERFGEKIPCQKFTAIGKLIAGEPYAFRMSDGFIPWRRNVLFSPVQEAPIAPLIESLSFIQNKQRWGFPFRLGCFTISESDFALIARAMGIFLHDTI